MESALLFIFIQLIKCLLFVVYEGICIATGDEDAFHHSHPQPCAFCVQGDSCICMQCVWTVWKGFTRSSASSASPGGMAAGTSWAPCTPTTSWLPLPAVRLVSTEVRVTLDFCHQGALPRGSCEGLEKVLLMVKNNSSALVVLL